MNKENYDLNGNGKIDPDEREIIFKALMDQAKNASEEAAKAIDEETLGSTLTVLLKYETDVAKARRMMGNGDSERGRRGGRYGR